MASVNARTKPSLWRRYWASLTGAPRPRPAFPVTGKADTLAVTPPSGPDGMWEVSEEQGHVR